MDKLFLDLDKDGDGHITKDELLSAMRERSPEVTEAAARTWVAGILREFDKDQDGLTRSEFSAFMSRRVVRLQHVFQTLDRSKTGRITAEDVRSGLKQADIKHMDADVDRVLRRMGAAPDNGVTHEGVNFVAFFDVSVLLPRMSAQHHLMLHTTAGCFPVVGAPPGTTPAMIVAAGCINGCVSRTMTAPMDRLRAVLATGTYPDARSAFRGILREQGAMGFWASNTANIVQVAPENGMSFFLNELLRDQLAKDPEYPTVGEKFAIGSAAGAIAMSVIYPMYVVQNRMAAAPPGRYGSMADCIREVGRGGAQSAYAGYGTALVRVLPLKGTMLGGYSTLKDLVKDPCTGDISTAKSLMCSAAAGGAAHALTYPLHLARTVLQQPVPEGGRVYAGFVDVLRHRLQTQGLGGWFRGLPLWLCNRVPAVAIEFAVNERALDAMKNIAGSRR